MLREQHPLGGQPVYVGGVDFGLAVAAEISVSEVVGQNIDDIQVFGPVFLLRAARQGATEAAVRISWFFMGYSLLCSLLCCLAYTFGVTPNTSRKHIEK